MSLFDDLVAKLKALPIDPRGRQMIDSVIDNILPDPEPEPAPKPRRAKKAKAKPEKLDPEFEHDPQLDDEPPEHEETDKALEA